MPKKSIRETLLARRKHLAVETCLVRSLLIQRRLLETAEFQGAAAVALYSPILNEVFTEELFRTARQMGRRQVENLAIDLERHRDVAQVLFESLSKSELERDDILVALG
jgi:5-formyltetrahydrofolate cyclo-ligase